MPGITTAQYNRTAKFLHWLIALAVIAMLAIGWTMENIPRDNPYKFPLFQWHKSIGITILLLSLFRLVWRLIYRPPPYPATMKPWEKGLAHFVHFLFYMLIIGMPLSGWLIVSSGGLSLPTMLYGVMPWPSLPLPDSINRVQLHELAARSHGLAAYLLAGLIVLHVAAAWKHHLFDHDDILLRMAPGFLHPLLRRLWPAAS